MTDARINKILVAALIAYSIVLLMFARFNAHEDHMLLNTVQAGLPFRPCIFPEIGRFSPLCFQELTLISKWWPSPYAYLAFGVALLWLFAATFFLSLREIAGSRLAALSLVLLLFPGFVRTWFPAQMIERDLTVFLALFLFSYLMFVKGRAFFLGGALIAGTLCLYYKEPAFILIGGFAAAHLVLDWRTRNQRGRLLDVLLLSSSAVFIVVYLIFGFSGLHGRYGSLEGTDLNSAWLLAKNVASYGLSDPVIMFVALPLAAWRAWRIFVQRREAFPVYDALLFAGVAYASLYFVLNLYAVYYWVPVYVFVVPALLFYYTRTGELRGKVWKAAGGLAAAVIVLSVLPTGLHLMSFYKYVPFNFERTVSFLHDDILRRTATAPTAIYIDGMAPDSGSIYFDSFNMFLQARGLPEERFIFRSELPRDFPGMQRTHPQTRKLSFSDIEYSGHYTLVQEAETRPIQPGDYLVIIPHGTREVSAEYLERLKQDYDLVFHTESPLAIPNVGLKTLLRLVATRLVAHTTSGPRGMSENYLGWPDYYVFLRRNPGGGGVK